MKSLIILLLLIFIFLRGAQAGSCNSLSCTVPGCLNYYPNTTTCYQCEDDYTLVTQSGETICVSCNINFCKECKQPDICYQCMDGYTQYNNQCNFCSIEGCQICSDHDVCEICQNSTQTGIYQPSCNGDACIQCNVNHCQKCNDQNSCCKCATGYKIQRNEGINTCVSVCCNVTNCFSCSQDNICSKCKPGYNLGSNNQCIQCKVDNCLKCSSKNICQNCQNQYYLNLDANKCIQCSIEKCSICTASNICSKCTNDTNVYLPSYTGDSCIQCNTENCFICTDTDQCHTCIIGYQILQNQVTGNSCIQCSYKDPITNQCVSCQIDKCQVCYTQNICSICQTVVTTTKTIIYKPNLSGKKCIQCNVTNCLRCQEKNKCSSCQNGLQLLERGNICIQCLVQNCQTCSANNFCSVCQTGYQPYSNNGSCFQCNQPCSECNPNGKCKQCKKPRWFYDPLSDGTCFKPTVPSCITYSAINQSICTQCALNYELNKTQNTCKFQCSSNCKTCSKTSPSQCKSCEIGQFLDGTVCQNCVFGCDECTSLSACTKASDGFYINSNGQVQACPSYCKKCTAKNKCKQLCNGHSHGNTIIQDQTSGETVLAKCAKGCKSCSPLNPEICLICEDGFYNTENGICYNCNSECKKCLPQSNTCLACFQNFKLNENNICTSCDDNCYTCDKTNTSKCLSCRQKQYLSSQNQCITGCPDNCQYCQSPTNCTTCYSGFTLYVDLEIQPVQVACVQCLVNCRTCVQGSPGQCIQCGDGFYKSGDTCLSCSNQCKSCTSKGCFQCNSGYALTSSLTCAIKCIFPCATCTSTNPNKCLTCFAGYTFQSVTQTCTETSICTNAKNCIACPAGYVLDGGKCNECKVQNCFKCLAKKVQTCTSCNAGYYLISKNNACNKCPTACKDCISETQCTQCIDGYYLQAKKKSGYSCIVCSQNCATCIDQSIKCTSCKQGWKLTGWKCQNSFKIVYQITFRTTMFVFVRSYKKLLKYLASIVGSDDPYIISVYAIWQGSVNFNGTASMEATTLTPQATENYNKFQQALQSPTIAGLPVEYSKVQYTGGQLWFPSKSDSGLSIILGVSIPVGILILIAIGLFVYYRKKSGQRFDQHSQNQTDYVGCRQRAPQQSGKVMCYQQNSLI